MSPRAANDITSGRARPQVTRGTTALIGKILRSAVQGPPAQEFLSDVSRWFLEHSGCSSVEIRVVERGRLVLSAATLHGEAPVTHEVVTGRTIEGAMVIPCLALESDLEKVCEEVVLRRHDPSLSFFTSYGSFCIGNSDQPFDLGSESCRWAGGRTVTIGGRFKSLLIIPFNTDNDDSGLILLKAEQREFFDPDAIGSCEYLARIFGMASSQRRAQIALRERVKELTCLYGIASVANPAADLESVLNDCVELLPPAWLHQEVAQARIEMDGRVYATKGPRASVSIQTAQILVNGKHRGAVSVAYSEQKPQLDEGPFLAEERDLLDAVAREIALLIETREAVEAQQKLHEQIRHADRLATIGQLAAGMAHELNEPLTIILGLAQLNARLPDLPAQPRKDSERIITAALHAREVIAKLKLFARQTPPKRELVDFNRVVNDGLYFLEARCAKHGIRVLKELSPDLPQIDVDAVQVQQVVVNLVVNAIQAMPLGGHLAISTHPVKEGLVLRVEDTGEGMDKETLDHIFDPFFTTKSADQGTGLGLSVVHGIVESHGGVMTVESKPGSGARFEVHLPLRGGAVQRNETSHDER